MSQVTDKELSREEEIEVLREQVFGDEACYSTKQVKRLYELENQV